LKLSNLMYQHAAHKTILATWLLELYLKRLDTIDMDGKLQKEEIKDKKVQYVEEIIIFLREHKGDLEKAERTVFHLLSTFGQTDILQEWSKIVNDYNKLIEWSIQKKDYERVQDLLKRSPPSIIYQLAPVLMFHAPEQTVDTLMSLGPDTVETEKLLPALLRCDYKKYADKETLDPVIKYLEFSIKRSKTQASPAVHNLLLARYAQQEDETALEAYIRRPESNFALDFGLQLCIKKNHQVSAVLIFAKMGMYEESVDAALTYGWDSGDGTMALANEMARKPELVERKKNADETNCGIFGRTEKNCFGDGNCPKMPRFTFH